MKRKCVCRKSNGADCRASALIGRDYCFFHDGESAATRRAAQRRGGENSRRQPVVLNPDTPPVTLNSMQDVLNLIATTIDDVRTGRLDVKVANSVGWLLTNAMRALVESPSTRPSDVQAQVSMLREAMRLPGALDALAALSDRTPVNNDSPEHQIVPETNTEKEPTTPSEPLPPARQAPEPRQETCGSLHFVQRAPVHPPPSDDYDWPRPPIPDVFGR